MPMIQRTQAFVKRFFTNAGFRQNRQKTRLTDKRFVQSDCLSNLKTFLPGKGNILRNLRNNPCENQEGMVYFLI